MFSMVTCINIIVNKLYKMFYMFVLFVYCSVSSSQSYSESNSTYLEQDFQHFIDQYHKDYAKDSEEYKKRLSIFQVGVANSSRL